MYQSACSLFLITYIIYETPYLNHPNILFYKEVLVLEFLFICLFSYNVTRNSDKCINH